MRRVCFFLVAGVFIAGFSAAAESHVDKAIEVAPVWAGHPVTFVLLTHPPYQYVAYYDADRRMTVAQRRLDTETWQFTVLPEEVGWDSHNYITLTLDGAGHLHLAGNMHVHPLTYFRSEVPYDAGTLQRIPLMTGREEERATYPVFFRGPEKELIFTYRDGSSGAGNQIYNVYDESSGTWRRLLDTPLVDGQGERNAYICGPSLGPDGRYHLCWVWRDTPDCATNHTLSYARSSDLIHWKNAQGAALSLPILFGAPVVADPVPAGGGIINGNTDIGFDGEGRVILSYHKYDEAGNTQLYNARLEEGEWRIYQSSHWDYRWAFSGGGTIHFEVRVEPVRVQAGGVLAQGWSHDRYGRQRWRLDPETLAPVEQLETPPSPWPRELQTPESAFPGMQVQWRGDSGRAESAGVRYVLRWETLERNRDRPREKPWPEPSALRVYRIVE